MTDDALTLVLAPDSKTGYAGVIEAKPGKPKPFQARMYCMEKKAQRALPGLYETAEEAARVLAKAKSIRAIHLCTKWSFRGTHVREDP